MEAAGREQFQNIFEWKEQTESTLSFDVYILYSKEDGGILSVFFFFAGKRSGVCLNIHFLRKERFKYVLIWWEYVPVPHWIRKKRTVSGRIPHTPSATAL